ncbi:MAG TPA: PIN domain-containing protein [Actinomycetota bacterium]|nr:PIN domain-containing protein [Actinomycetota bacterium]
MMPPIGVDTSVALALLVASHRQHAAASAWSQGREVALSGHAAAETFSVMTRLPGDARFKPEDAALLIRSRFAPCLVADNPTLTNLPDILAPLGIAGGAVYDALVGLAARDNGVQLATRDARALPTYERLGISVVVVE